MSFSAFPDMVALSTTIDHGAVSVTLSGDADSSIAAGSGKLAL